MALLNSIAGKPAASDNSDLTGDTDNPTMNGEGGQDTGEDDTQDGADEDQVLCTVLISKDGKYTLVTGDEPDSEDGLAAPEGASPAEGGTPAPPEGQQFDEPGPLLKAILDLIRGSEGAGGDGGQADFEAGFGAKPKE